jgi:sulfonate transport system substrate-binding protein
MKRILAAILCLIMVVAGVGCAQTATPQATPAPAAPADSAAPEATAAPETPAEPIPLKISHHPYIHGLPSIYAEDNGYYDAFDFTIDMYASGPVQNEAIPSGAWEVGTTGMGGAVLGAIGYNLKILGITAGDTNTVDIWVRPDSPLASIAPDDKGVRGTADDWRGKTILCASGTTCHMNLIGTLNHLGLTEKDVNIVDTAVASSYTAFAAGEGDIVCLWSPFGFKAESEGLVKVSSVAALGLEMPCLIVCTEETYNNRRDVVKQWVKAYEDSAMALMADPDEAQILFDFETDEGIAVTFENCQSEVKARPFYSIEEQAAYFVDNGGTNRLQDIMREFAQFMVSQGKIKEEDVQKVVDCVDGSIMQELAANQ